MRCAVLGAGAWGTALAIHLCRQGHQVVLWDRDPARCKVMNRTGRNPRHLSRIPLPSSLTASPDLAGVVAQAQLLVPALPSHALREVMTQCAQRIAPTTYISCATKGLEEHTYATMHQVLLQVLPAHHHKRTAMLYGPSFALEVAQGLATAAVCAGTQPATHHAAEAFHGGALRVYHTEDVAGVCLGGSLKNVMAIACGVADGIGLGSNTRAALITRGLAEISRLAVALGGDPLTLMGLAGMGDLVLTCTGDLSRNRRVGLALGQGRTLSEVLHQLGEVAEGVATAQCAKELARKHNVEMPITEQVWAMLYRDKPAEDALGDLLGRERRAERD